MSAQPQDTTPQGEYLLLFRGKDWYNDLSPEELQAAMTQFKTWFDRLTEQGKLKGAQPLVRQGRVVSGKDGRVVADGPFAESKEAIGGYFLLAVNSLDEAVQIARGCPGLEHGMTVEVRPVAEECPMMARARQVLSEQQLAHAGA
ncbi:MAG: hypothetical protein HYR88_12950 [Verrucomicrobia bacterium]|nr:hypothetical protein [Verrucomicrobiota bacterium]MBI3866964.1 hypothetical protein [Verrucomicrobiota bacterium]